MENKSQKNILWLDEIGIEDVPLVGGKNASLGEMSVNLTPKGVKLPDGFALTTNAYWKFLKVNGLDKKLKEIFRGFNPQSVKSIQETGRKCRTEILKGEFPDNLKKEILDAYAQLGQKYGLDPDVAVRTSGVCEDMPNASFAGQFETYLNVRGSDALLDAVKKSIVSTFTDRAIAYREEKKIAQLEFALSVGVLKMIRSDLASSGIIFTLDTETGFPGVVLINSIWGIGEMIVKGKVTPDEFYVFKPTLKDGFNSIIVKNLGRKKLKYIYASKGGLKETKVSQKEQLKFSLNDEEILTLAKWAVIIEEHYSTKYGKWMPQDIEWAKDGKTGQLFIVQSRPETVHAIKTENIIEEYRLNTDKLPVLSGAAIGEKIGAGKVHIIEDVSRIAQFKPGEVLVTKMTDPDWVPIMRLASAIVTDEGGKTCFGGETKILTNKGLLSIREVVENRNKEKIKVLSLNKEKLDLEWKEVIDGFQRKAPLTQIEISQSGRMKNNILETTFDHKFLTFNNREIISKEIKNILRDKEGIVSIFKVPSFGPANISSQMSYLLGAISTDGNIFCRKCGKKFVYTISFIQKPTSEKREFIERVKDYFQKEYGYFLHIAEKPPSRGIIRGKEVVGEKSTLLRCFRKEIVKDFLEKQTNISKLLLGGSVEFNFNFLAGVIDGDGTYYQKSNRINIYCSKNELLNAIVIACLRIGVNFQIVNNRSIYNIQIVDGVDEILKYTARVKGEYSRTRFGTRFFAAKQLLEDIIKKVNYSGRILPYVIKNLLIDTEKIRNYVVPLIKGAPENHALTNIINSPLKMLRVSVGNSLGIKDVYNIEVGGNHNYIVFTNRNTPVLVDNCHAAIVSRELGVPAIVGTGKATKVLKTGQIVTVDCSQGMKGRVFLGKISFDIKKNNLAEIPEIKTKITMNIGDPQMAFKASFLPNSGVGLAREEFIIAEKIRIHPMALYNFEKIKDKKLKKRIQEITVEHKDKKEFFVKELAEGVAQIAAAFYPKEIIVRFSDFKTNEYRNLIGGSLFEELEANPMMGFRGASRYISEKYQPAFLMECEAIKRVREVFGLKNVNVMIPFCRTVEEGQKVIELMKNAGLSKETNNIKIYVMCEIPSNVILAEEFLEIFDGFSIGSNDLTQLTLGLDRDNGTIAYIGDERNEAVKELLRKAIKACKEKGKYSGICGEAPSNYPEFAEFLVEQGIESMSLNPNVVLKTHLIVAEKEKLLNQKK
ncbi:phosphoenolpyruvate synthase [Patescibacteria group bacterium]|nr:phosphoenolpyruvate synthase [Patescibacteria group bacterium]MBU4367782.1 phosphoenolpyruvate synthase [Patescibacteria group bacterium]MBU4461472.1 phosphoenolpyruvate synthase [Patescibacteria group bacterium]MCG2700396.1 phosphoenolpyruvate synthase [Candidatus Parcubacteria bacterium]